MSKLPNDTTTRRDFNKLAVAALGGAIAGALPGCGGPAGAPLAADAADPKPASDENPLIAGGPHVCRGLNQCKGKGAGATNTCAGEGNCATAKKHDCQAANACKGQGGCGEHPGENQCKGQGACAVPLDAKKWDKARKRFEELMTKAAKKFGAAPAAKS